MAADRARLAQINGGADAVPDTLGPEPAAATRRVILPTVRLVWSSRLPAEGYDDALWAGRGVSGSVTGGVAYARRLRGRRLDVVLSPTLTYSQNLPFPIRAGAAPGRSAFSSPFYFGDVSADLPLRFGDLPMKTIGPGQSSITLTTTHVAVGAATDNEWWGPALQNTLLLSNAAAGVPRLFVRATHPWRTRAGAVEGRAFVGALTESPFFDTIPSNNHRSLSGLLVVYHPPLDSGLTLGLARLVVARTPSAPGALLHAFDALFLYNASRPPSDTTDAGASEKPSDQLTSLFARWVFPQSGFETYVEWARSEPPRSVREILEVPQLSQAYTIGAQWGKARRGGRMLRLQGELTYLEQTQFVPDRPPRDYYTGQAAVQGFTQRGQLLGAAIGPGASSQFVAGDWLTPGWQAGVFLGRTRNENDALYREGGPRLTQHDVTVYSGVRAGLRLPRYDVLATLTVGRRYNYLLQSVFYLATPVNAVDVPNTALKLAITPR